MRRRPRVLARVVLLVVVLWLPAAARAAEPTVHARLTHVWRDYKINPDLTYTATITIDAEVLTKHGIAEAGRSALTFYPNNQKLDVVEAWVDEPDGTRLPVPDSGRFTRPSEAAQDAPGFTSSMTTTLLYPQVQEGSRTHVVWRLTQTKPALLGVNIETVVPLSLPVGEARVSITAPASVPLHWRERGGFAVTDRTEAGLRHITARIANTKAELSERHMVDEEDFVPMFLATTLPDLKSLGAIYYHQAQAKAAPTPEIAALAHRLAGDRTGLDAARAVYDWVAGHIRYVAVYLDPNDGWVPHAAAEVLRNGYGDCKDHVVLMQAMLAALGIKAEAALIEDGNRTRDLPLWVPQFNHVIVYLPDEDVFANPTDPYARFAAQDEDLAGKTVVLATPEGEVRQTPPQSPERNRYSADSRLAIATDGTITGTATIEPSSDLESAARAAIIRQDSPRQIAERLLAVTPEGGFGSFTTSDPRDLTTHFRMQAAWHSPHGVTFDGREAFVAVPIGPDLAPVSRLRGLLSDDGPRRHPLLTAARDSTWRTTLAIPAGLAVTRLPQDVHFANAAGSYTASYQRQGRDVAVARRLVIAKGLFPADQYDALQALIYAALEDSRAVLGLAREQAAN